MTERRRALRIGLTGGIGSGKSTVAEEFARHGVPVIDTDVIARDLVEPGRPALEEIVDRFGAELLDASGRLDRAQLRRRVFADPDDRRALEAILHPRIRQETLRRADASDAPYCVLVIPLLVESGMQNLVDRILVVDLPEDEQVRRTMARDNIAEAQARAIVAAQVSRDERLRHADDVIDNGGTEADLERRVEHLHRRYLTLARPR